MTRRGSRAAALPGMPARCPGSLGDLGTFLPHIVGAIAVVGMDPTGILATFGLFHAFAAAFYGIPTAVQPMKTASAAVLIEPMDPAAIAGAGILFFSGIELALSAKPQAYRDTDLFLVLLMAAVGVALNPAAAFAVGWPLAIAFKRGGLSLHSSEAVFLSHDNGALAR
jgi:hypothetical protein